MDNNDLRDYLVSQMGYNHLIKEVAKQKYFARHMKILLEKHIRDFLSGSRAERWIVIPGLRGVGKTTLVAQVYSWVYHRWVNEQSDKQKVNMLYISLDAVRNLGGNLTQALKVYESLLASRLENASQPVFLFIDEIQVDAAWARILKTVYDRTSNVFTVCTGSAATYLQLDADTAGRRAKIERLYPLSFTEYQMLAHNKLPTKGLKRQLVRALYYSSDAREVYQHLAKMQPVVDKTWGQYDPNQVEDYLQTGTMPFTFWRDKADTYKALMDNIDKVVTDDLVTDRRFDFSRRSIVVIKQLLFLLAGSSTTPSLKNLSDTLSVDVKNLSEMLGALVKAEVLIRIPSYGGDFAVTRQPVRYQFMSPALRSAYWNITGSRRTAESRRGQLMEDVAALHYYREFTAQNRGSLTYVYAKTDLGHCDFVLKVIDSHQIALEFGLGQKTTRQVRLTMNTVDCDYGLVFSESPLKISRDVVMVPLRYFFLM